MAVVTQSPGGQSSAVINGQSIAYIAQQVLQIMPGAPDGLVNTVLQQVLRDFYYRSAGWVEIIGPYNIVGGRMLVPLNPVDQYAQCHLVKQAFLYPDTTGVNRPKYLFPLTQRRYGHTPAPPAWYSMDKPDLLRLDPVPDQNYGPLLYVKMVLMPVINAGRLPNISVTHHFDGLLMGTLYRLGIMPNKPWTVKEQVTLNEWKRTYGRYILLARDMAERQYGPADAGFLFPRFAPGSQFPLGGGVGP